MHGSEYLPAGAGNGPREDMDCALCGGSFTDLEDGQRIRDEVLCPACADTVVNDLRMELSKVKVFVREANDHLDNMDDNVANDLKERWQKCCDLAGELAEALDHLHGATHELGIAEASGIAHCTLCGDDALRAEMVRDGGDLLCPDCDQRRRSRKVAIAARLAAARALRKDGR